MRWKVVPVCVAFACLASAAQPGEEIKLWPNGAPGSEGVTAEEVSKPSVNPKYAALPGDISVSDYPSIYLFPAPKEKATGAAMIVAPGGGPGFTQKPAPVMVWTGRLTDWLADRGISK